MFGERLTFSDEYTVIFKENGPVVLMMFLTVFTVLSWLMVSLTNVIIGSVTVFTIAVTYLVFLLFTFMGYIIKYISPNSPGSVIDLGDPKETWLNVGLGAVVGVLVAVTFFATVKIALAPTVTSAVLLLVTCLVGPLIEELFFHGWVLPTSAQYLSRPVGIVATNLVFALYHMGTWGTIGVAGFFVPFTFGIILSLLTLKLKSVAPAIIAHMAANTVLSLSAVIIPALTLVMGVVIR